MNARILLAVLSVTFSVHVNAAASSKYTTTPIGTAQAISFQDALPDVILAGQQGVHQLFGGFVVSGGDVNGDGYDDFAVTASRFSDCRGRAYLYFGGRDRVYESADHIFDGENAGDVFGEYIILADLNNDKYAVSSSAQLGTGTGKDAYTSTSVDAIWMREPIWSLMEKPGYMGGLVVSLMLQI